MQLPGGPSSAVVETKLGDSAYGKQPEGFLFFLFCELLRMLFSLPPSPATAGSVPHL
jgi:hypothetical protein